MLYNETLNISKSMTKCALKPTTDELILQYNAKDSLKKTIIRNKEKFIEFIQVLPLELQSQDTNINFKNSSTIIMTLRTTCFKVDFNENFVKITPLQ